MKYDPYASNDSFPTIVVIMILLAGLLMLPISCTNDEGARDALDAAGYTDITLNGYGWFSCGDDAFSTQFTATNPRGKKVSGVVCCGFAKACTIRH